MEFVFYMYYVINKTCKSLKLMGRFNHVKEFYQSYSLKIDGPTNLKTCDSYKVLKSKTVSKNSNCWKLSFLEQMSDKISYN